MSAKSPEALTDSMDLSVTRSLLAVILDEANADHLDIIWLIVGVNGAVSGIALRFLQWRIVVVWVAKNCYSKGTTALGTYIIASDRKNMIHFFHLI